MTESTAQKPDRYLRAGEQATRVPINVVWEITTACDQACKHCGSRSGRRDSGELSTEEALRVIDELAAMGTREVSLIGGEVYLRKDWPQLVSAIRDKGMNCGIQTGGRNLSPERAATAAHAGVKGIGVSVDGMRSTHDYLRGVVGSFDNALKAVRLISGSGMTASVNTQINAMSMPELPKILEVIAQHGATHWQLALTVAMGRASEHPEILLQPYDLLDLFPALAALKIQARGMGVSLQIANNLGYFGPHESELRGVYDDETHWHGCSAGDNVLGIESDGNIKGCPSLPAVYRAGSVRDTPVATLWRERTELAFNRNRSTKDLWGFCATCYYADTCLAGCTWTSHSLLGRPGNNPMCHHRALQFQRMGQRECLIKVASAPGSSFDHGEFAIVVEPLEAPRRQRCHIPILAYGR